MTTSDIQVGDRIRVVKEIGRQDIVERITVNSLGTTLYWLSLGGIFGGDEIELVKKNVRNYCQEPLQSSDNSGKNTTSDNHSLKHGTQKMINTTELKAARIAVDMMIENVYYWERGWEAAMERLLERPEVVAVWDEHGDELLDYLYDRSKKVAAERGIAERWM